MGEGGLGGGTEHISRPIVRTVGVGEVQACLLHKSAIYLTYTELV